MAASPTPDSGPPDQEPFNIEELLNPNVPRRVTNLPQLTWRALRLVRKAAPGELILTSVLQVVTALALVAQVLIAKKLLSTLLADNTSHSFRSAIPWIAALAGILAITAITGVLRLEFQRLLSELVARSATQQVVSAACSADLIRFENPAFHDRLQRATVNATVRPLQMTTGLVTVMGSLLSTLAIGFTLVLIDPLFAVLAIVAGVPVTLTNLRVGRALYSFDVEQTPTDRERSYVQILLTGKDSAKDVRAYNLTGYLRARFDSLYARRIDALRKLIRHRTIQGVAGGLLTAIFSGAVLGLLILFVSDGSITLAGAGAAAAALILLGTQIQGLASGFGNLFESALFIQDFNEFVEVVPRSGQFTGKIAPSIKAGPLTVQNLSFTYPSRAEPALSDINVTIGAGQVIALVGENGSGKTTLAKLLAGLYQPESGSIAWSGADIADLDILEVRSRVAVLFQDFARYFLSAEENIAMGRWERAFDKEAIRMASERAGASEFLERLPGGYDTYLGPQFYGGSDLSGGQWQRLALARAFFRDAELVILDEPTAALDPRSEAALFQSVRDLFAGRSVVLISHRFASVRMADYIYVLNEGRVAEQGTHGELMAARGLYAELFTMQVEAFGLGEGPSDFLDPLDSSEQSETTGHPLIAPADGPSGPRVRLTEGPDVDAVVRALTASREAEPELSVDDILQLVSETSGVSLEMIRAAVAFWADSPDDIDVRIQRSRHLAISTAVNSYTVNDDGAWSVERPPDPLLLDQMFSDKLALLLDDLGIDCRSVYSNRAEGVTEAALKEHRVIVTGNVLDFEEIRRRRAAARQRMAGIIYVTEERHPRDRRFLETIPALLARAATEHWAMDGEGVYWLE
jgi:ATP-binding cassette subfamily B protein